MLPTLLAIAVGCFVFERLVPGWRLPRVKTWPARVVLINLVQLGVVLLAGITWERWLASWSVFPPVHGDGTGAWRDDRVLRRNVRLLLVAPLAA